MKPTLFSRNNGREMFSTMGPAADVLYSPPEPSLPMLATTRILPVRCDDCDGTGWLGGTTPPVVGASVALTSCESCSGRGWLYPPMPEWFKGWDEFARDLIKIRPGEYWETHCERSWRVMGILEDDDGKR